jgi:NitT/TauT family transport system substrate-binding protein
MGMAAKSGDTVEVKMPSAVVQSRPAAGPNPMSGSAHCRASGNPAVRGKSWAATRGAAIAALIVCLSAMLAPAYAEEQVKIGTGYGLAFLPIYVCQELKLIEKHAKAAHLDVRASFQPFLRVEELQDAIATGAIDMGPFGMAPLLAAWAKDKGAPQQIFAISGLTTLPMTLLSNQANQQSLADLTPADHIAVPTPTAPQMYLLELQSEKIFGRYDRLQKQVVVLSHADAIAALVDHSNPAPGQVTAYFASPPFTQLALRDSSIHPILNSTDVMGGKLSFLIMGASKATIDAKPLLPDLIERAIDEAARFIHDDPRRAAQIYLTHEPSGTFSGAAMEAVVRSIKDEFGSAVYGVQTVADFMARHGELRTPPRSWKEIVAPALLNSPST